MSDDMIPERRRPSIALICSLCLNALLVGIVVISVMRMGTRMFEPRGENGAISARALMRLVPAEKDKIQAVVDAHLQDTHALRSRTVAARGEAFRILTAPDFDKDAFARALAEVQSADAAFEAETLKITAESVAVMTPAERQSVAARVQWPRRMLIRRMIHP